MPWEEADAMDQRRLFVALASQPGQNRSRLCRDFGISRKTGYKWIDRFDTTGSLAELAELSRAPHHSPQRTNADLASLVIWLRQGTGWGGRKLQRVLAGQGFTISASTIDRIIKREGLIAPEDRRQPTGERWEREAPNDLWQMDFKGQFRHAGRDVCFPLTLLDDHSRFCPGIFALESTAYEPVRDSLIECFTDHGMPDDLYVDRGVPWWANAGETGLTRLAVWLIELGINLIYGTPGHPQGRGKLERLHRTFERWMSRAGIPECLGAFPPLFDQFRYQYNLVRPHESLEMDVPASRYRPSRNPYDPTPPPWDYPEGADVRRLGAQGSLYYEGRRYFISQALEAKSVWCVPVAATGLLVRFRHMDVREIDLSTGRTTPIVRPSKRTHLLPMS